MRSTLAGRLGAAVFAAVLAFAGLLAAPGAAVASPSHHHGHPGHHHGHHGHHHPYQAPVQSNPHLSAHPSGGGAVVGVSVSHRLSGRAMVIVSPGRTYSVRVSNGKASVYFPTSRGTTYRITVVFIPTGNRWAVGGSDTITYRAGSAHGSSSNPKITLTSSTTRTAAAPLSSGPDATAGLLGVLGVGLVGAGSVSIAVNRRRNRVGS